MNEQALIDASQPGVLSTYLSELPDAHHHGSGPLETVRSEEYRGHDIQVVTTYTIAVDGKEISVPLGVDNSGRLHCHALPNYEFESAVDMVKRLIDWFPEDFTPPGNVGGAGGHGGHHPGGGH